MSELPAAPHDRRRVSVDEARSPWQKASGAFHSARATRGTFGDFDGDGVFVGEQDFSRVEPDDELGWPDFGICVGCS